MIVSGGVLGGTGHGSGLAVDAKAQDVCRPLGQGRPAHSASGESKGGGLRTVCFARAREGVRFTAIANILWGLYRDLS